MAAIAISFHTKLNKVLEGDTFFRTSELKGYIDDCEELQRAISLRRGVLIDGEAKWDQLPNQQLELIRKLKDVVYDADDHVDEFLTLVETNTNKLLSNSRKRRKFFKKMSRELKDIHKRLAVIDVDYRDFRLLVNVEPVRIKMEESCSDVDASDIIIGRVKDKDTIINMLLDPIGDRGVRFLSIVGVGGLGKTALARLVFNDDIIKQEFPDPNDRIWVSVSDSDEEQFKLKAHFLKNLIIGKKYFIVLDDVWNENYREWVVLRQILKFSQWGSKVLVTTRSMRTATVIGNEDDDSYMLQLLSKEDSWHLFKSLAFNPGMEEKIHNELLEIGKNIAATCCGHPGTIKVIGNLLCGEPISEWQSFHRSGLVKIRQCYNDILHNLILCYIKHNPSTLSCFSYCAIFSKDVRIRKEKIIGLWIAQEYVMDENDAEKLFSNLVGMCFFEDIVKDQYGDIESFKVNSLMHDIAQELGQEAVCTVTSNMNCLGNDIRHVHHVSDESLDITLCSKKIRSYVGGSGHILENQIDNLMGLRVLDLTGCKLKILPDSVGKLLHLRYLDLSNCKTLELLCDSITQLYNLQVLDIHNCENLTCMPLGMSKLTNLRVLPLFVVGNGISSEKQCSEGMFEDLKALNRIKGKICIKIGSNYRALEEGIDIRRKYLELIYYLREIRIEFKDDGICSFDPQALLDKFQPPPHISVIRLHNYIGTRINWLFFFPFLVHLVFWKCGNLQQIPVLRELSSLKILTLFCLDSLEYMENAMGSTSSNVGVAEFFPSLETLNIMWMERLKGWWKMDGVVDDYGLRLRFPRLLHLKIYKCPNLISFAPCQTLEHMTVHEFHSLRSLKIANCPSLALNLVCPIAETLELRDIGERSKFTCGNSQNDGKWRFAEVDKVRNMNPVTTYCLTHLCIHGDLEVESLLEVKNVFHCCGSTLRKLEIRYCANLTELLGLEHLTVLEKLKLLGNNQLSISKDEEEPWKFLHQSLLHLKFDALPKMRSLPKGMRNFTSLQILEIRWCENFEELPEWMNCLSSLKYLSITHCARLRSLPEAMKDLSSLQNLSIKHGCPELYRRCKNPDGEDFHKIQHIQNFSIGRGC